MSVTLPLSAAPFCFLASTFITRPSLLTTASDIFTSPPITMVPSFSFTTTFAGLPGVISILCTPAINSATLMFGGKSSRILPPFTTAGSDSGYFSATALSTWSAAEKSQE